MKPLVLQAIATNAPVWRKRRRLLLGGGAGLAALAWGRLGWAAPAPRIVASFSILADITRELAPAGAEVTSLVGADADAHVFEPTPSAARRLAQADMVVINGLGFEGWIERLIKISGFKGPIVVASQGVAPRRAGKGVDPHAWQDLGQTRRYVANLSAALLQRWPLAQAELAPRQQDYLQRINALDQQVRQQFGQIPREQRRVVTSHDAFGYFADAYGVDFFAPQGWNTDSEPSAAAVARLIRQIRQQQLRAVFVENISAARLVQQIAQEGGVVVGGRLYSDALSAPGGPAETYLKMFAHNAKTLLDALRVRR